MGQKVHPKGLRLGIVKDWDSKWFARFREKEFPTNVLEDYKIRKYLKERLYQAGISRIVIERVGAKIRIFIFAARPGLVIGRKGAEVNSIKSYLRSFTGKEIVINVNEVKTPEIEAQLVAENIASQIERRINFRRAMKQAVNRAMKMGAQGIKVACSGRLGGAEIARTEWYLEGRVPLHTLRADIDYGFIEAMTTYGKIGVKTWIFKGEVLPTSEGESK